jgi:hypothetical protein
MADNKKEQERAELHRTIWKLKEQNKKYQSDKIKLINPIEFEYMWRKENG